MSLDLAAELAHPMLAKAVGYLVDRASRHASWFREEAESACNLGIAQAAATWRPDGGATFRTLAIQCMKNAISHAWRTEGRNGAAARGVYSLDAPYPDGETLGDAIESGEEPAGWSLEWDELAAAVLEGAGQDRGVVKRRYLDPDSPKLREVAAELGVTRERVRQLEVRGLQRAKRALERAG